MSPKKRPNHGLQRTPKAVHVIECSLAWARIVEMCSTGRAAEAWSLVRLDIPHPFRLDSDHAEKVSK